MTILSFPLPCAQVPPAPPDLWTVRGHIIDAHHQPISGVHVHFESPGVEWTGPSLLLTDVYGEFRTPLGFLPASKEGGESVVVILKAEKDGYAPGWCPLERPPGPEDDPIELVLQDEDRIGNLPMPETVLSELAGYYTQRENLEPVSPAAHDALSKGAKEFLGPSDRIGGGLKIRRGLQADPACLSCQMLMGLVYFQGGAWSKSERVLSQIASTEVAHPNPRYAADARAVLAVMRILADDWEAARKLLASAADTDPSSPLVLRELGRFLMFQGRLDLADQCFRDALEKGATPEVYLLRSEIFLLRQNLPEAAQQYRLYWEKSFPFIRDYRYDRSGIKASPYSRYVAKDLRTLAYFVSYGHVESAATLPLPKVIAAFPPLQGIRPADSQRDLPSLLEKMSSSVDNLVSRLPNTISDELFDEKRLDSKGRVKETQEFRLQYLLLIRPQWATTFALEHRVDPKQGWGESSLSERVWLTTINSIMAMTLLHPRHRKGTTFRLLGSQELNGRTASVIGFAQEPLQSKVQGFLNQGALEVPYLLQGVIWLDPATGQIMRTRSELLKPLKEARIRSYTTETDYAETAIAGAAGRFWLPHHIAVRIEGESGTFDSQHSFSGYRLYSAESTIKTDLEDAQ